MTIGIYTVPVTDIYILSLTLTETIQILQTSIQNTSVKKFTFLGRTVVTELFHLVYISMTGTVINVINYKIFDLGNMGLGSLISFSSPYYDTFWGLFQTNNFGSLNLPNQMYIVVSLKNNVLDNTGPMQWTMTDGVQANVNTDFGIGVIGDYIELACYIDLATEIVLNEITDFCQSNYNQDDFVYFIDSELLEFDENNPPFTILSYTEDDAPDTQTLDYIIGCNSNNFATLTIEFLVSGTLETIDWITVTDNTFIVDPGHDFFVEMNQLVTVRVTYDSTINVGVQLVNEEFQFTLQTTLIAKNHAPVIYTTDCITQPIEQGIETSCTIEPLDKDVTDTVTLSLFSGQTWITTSGMTVTFFPNDFTLNGSQTVEFRLTDDNNGSFGEGILFFSHIITVTVSELNNPPVIQASSCSDRTVSIGSSKSCTLSISDLDADEVFSVTLPNAEAWVSVTDRTVTFTPTISEIGDNTVLIRVSDSDSNAQTRANGVQITEHSVIISVSDMNAVPIIISHNCENEEIFVGEQYICSITEYSDEDLSDIHTFFASPAYNFITLPGSTIMISPTTYEQSGVLDIQFIVKDSNSNGASNGAQSDSIEFELTILSINTEPYFENAISDHIIIVGEVLAVMIPTVKDAEQTLDFTFEYKSNGNSLTSFMIVTNGIIEINPKDEDDAGIYEIEIIVTDSVFGYCQCDRLTATTSFIVEIVGPESEEAEALKVTAAAEVAQNDFDAASLFEIKEPTKKDVLPQILLKTISDTGLVTLEFTQQMFKTEASLIASKVLDLKIVTDFELYDPKEMLKSWVTVSSTASKIELQLELDNPILISSFSNPDFLSVEVLRPSIFVSYENSFMLSGKLVLKLTIPPQIVEQAGFSEAKQLGSFLDSSGKAAVMVNFLSKLFLSSALNMLWSLINTLQVLVYFPMSAVPFPANATSFSFIFIQLCQFDILPHELITSYLFEFDPKNVPKYSQFRKSDYVTNNFIQNGGSAFWFIPFYFAGALLSLIFFSWSKRPFIKRQYQKFKAQMYYGIILRLMLEGFMELTVACFIQVMAATNNFSGFQIENYKSGDMFALVNAFVVLFIIFLFIVYSIVVSFVPSVFIKNKQTEEMYGTLQEDIKAEGKSAKFVIPLFLLRRLLFGLTLILTPENAGFQIIVTNYLSFFLIIYFLNFRPFKKDFLNKIEIVNETTVLFLSYFLLTFSDFNPDPKIKSIFGVFYCFCFSTCVGINLLLMLLMSVGKPLRNKCKRKKETKKFVNHLLQTNRLLIQNGEGQLPKKNKKRKRKAKTMDVEEYKQDIQEEFKEERKEMYNFDDSEQLQMQFEEDKENPRNPGFDQAQATYRISNYVNLNEVSKPKNKKKKRTKKMRV